jgi:hypothetical protein
MEWEKNFASSSMDQRLISRTYENLKELNNKRTNNPIIKWSRELNRAHMFQNTFQGASFCLSSHRVLMKSE